MPLHVQLDLPPARALNINDYEPSFAAYMRAAWGDADNDNPGTVTGNMLEASERRYGFNVMDVAEAGGLTGGLEELAQAEPLSAWSQEEQKAYIRDEGLEGVLSPGEHYTRPELEFLAMLKHEEIERKLTREKASAWYAPFGFLAGLGASFTDPVNLATSLVPVLPEARMMQLLAKSGSAWGRAGIRAGVGAAEGAVGAAVVEPMIIGGKTELQQEYGLADSLMNVVFGAAMGAVMKPAAGALGDWMRQKKGQRQPWEYVPSSDLTERFRNENAARIWAGMRESGAEKLLPEHAEAAAALWDATLRGYAYDTGELVGDVYARYRTEWHGDGMEIVDMRGNVLEQPAYHGTPHRFNEFSLDAIGTGEGAQAHGWGLYFAQDKKISDDYRNRLRRGRSRGQLFEVDIPENDVLLDEQKTFAEQPEEVKSALRSIYKSFSKEQLAPVREEMKVRVMEDRALAEKGEDLRKKRQRLFNRRRALKTVNAERPSGSGNPFEPEKSTRLFELGEKYLHEMYSDTQIERLQNDADYLSVEKASVDNEIAALEQEIAENEQRIEVKREKERAEIDKARPDTLLSRMNGSDLYSGISIALGSSRVASERLNEQGIKGITYEGGQDGRCFVVFDDKAVEVLNTFYQGSARGNQPSIVVHGDELGVPDGAEIGEYRKAAREVYRQLQKTPAQREDLGEIQFTKAGWSEAAHTGADARKWKLFPKLKELIEKAEYVERHELNKLRKDDIVAFHWLESNVDLAGERLRVGLQIAEDSRGNKFYNINQDLEEWGRKYKALGVEPAESSTGPQGLSEAPDNRSGQYTPGAQELSQDASASFDTRITTDDDGVNLYILSEQAPSDGNPRARVTFGEADAYAVVEFFKTADPSTAPHEMYHIFRRIMADMYDDPNASEASRERYRKACEFVGAEPGKGWTREQEEMFARAGERFLLEGVTPNPRMGDVMESFRQWMEEVYGNAERSGLEISDGMRALFGGMMGTAEDGDISFRYAMGKLLDYSPEKAIDTRVELPAEHTADGAPEQMLEAYAQDSAARLEEAYSALADRPEAQERFCADLEAEMAEVDAAVMESQRRGEIMRAAAACIMRS